MEKTTVTNASVSESEELESKPQPGEGKIPSEKDIENRVRKNLEGEYSRKTEELSSKLQEYQDQIEELKEQNRLSVTERERLKRLESGRNEIEEELEILETDKKYKPYIAAIDKRTSKTKEEAIKEAHDSVFMTLAVRARAKAARSEGITEKEMIAELNPIMKGRWLDLDPMERVELALEERTKLKADAKREAERKAKELEESGLEAGQTKPRERTLSEIKKSGDNLAHAAALGL